MRTLRLALLLAGAALSGCEMAPAYHPPVVATPPAFKEDTGWSLAKPQDDQPRGPWWQVYHDADLDRIEDQVTTANQDLKAAAARYDQARALARSAKAALSPTVDLGAGASGGSLSRAVSNPEPHRNTNLESLSLDVSYEPDVWGRIRDSARAAGSRAQASAGDLASAALSLHAEAATDYFSLRGDDAQIAILDDTTANYARALELTRARFAAGYAASQDVAAAEAALDLARTRAADVRLDRARLEHAIAIITGQPPAAFSLSARVLVAEPPAVARALPGDLLQRRPDIAAAERRVAAANHDIGAVRAAFYPDFNLGGLIGAETQASAPLFGANAATWALGASGVLNLFDGGRRRAARAQATGEFDEAAAQYRQSVLAAYGEVEDNLAAQTRLAQESATQTAAVAASTRARQQATARYTAGYANYYEVVTAQGIELSARLDLALITARRMNASVLLIKALGGGWNP